MKTSNVFYALSLSVLTLGVTACNSSSPAAPASAARMSATSADLRPGNETIVGIVLKDDGEFDVLQAAVVRAGLVDALGGSAQLTVFAPTDAAFVASLKVANEAAAIAAVNGLPVDTVKNILLYHVTEGRRISKSILAAPSYQMLNGQTLTRAQLTAAGFTTTDVSASNGVVHVINAVLMP